MFVGPALEGATWSMLGPWAGFALISLWGVALPVAVLSIPRRGFIPLNDKDRQSLTPDLRSYVAAGKLLRIPGIMLVILTTFLRIACFSIRGSFYPVYLGQAGFSGSVIGLLVSLGSVIGGMAALLADFFVWLCGSQRNALLIGVALGIISVAITPLMPGVVLLATTACVFGVAMGINQPILLSMLSSSVSYEYQGMSVGLRTTANLVAGVSIRILDGLRERTRRDQRELLRHWGDVARRNRIGSSRHAPRGGFRRKRHRLLSSTLEGHPQYRISHGSITSTPMR
jgi:hypothetical protein